MTDLSSTDFEKATAFKKTRATHQIQGDEDDGPLPVRIVGANEQLRTATVQDWTGEETAGIPWDMIVPLPGIRPC